MAERADYYAVLGVLPTVEDDALAAVYRALVKKYHPDVYAGPSGDAESITKKITEAYGVLSDPSKRAAYDRARSERFESDETQPSGTSARRRRFGFLHAATFFGATVILGFLVIVVWRSESTDRKAVVPAENDLVAMPAGFLGSWAQDPAGCRSSGVPRVTISATSLVYAGYEPVDIRSLRPVGEKDLVVNVLPQTGPQNESTSGRWRLSPDRTTLIIAWDDAPLEILHRCES